jgi:hypothetical protein
MKRSLALLILLAALPALLAACSAGHDASAPSADNSLSRARSENPAQAGLERAPYTFSVMEDAADIGSAGMEVSPEAADTRKIIWNASLDIEAEDAAGLHRNLATRASELGGYEYTNSIQHYETYSVVRSTYKVPPRHIHDFIAYAGEGGKVINSSLGSEDITESYFDAAQRLQTKRATLEPYYRLLADAKNLDEVIKIQRIIDGVTEEIESLEGRLRVWDVLTDMATVSIYIRQYNDPVAIPREINWNAMTAGDMGYLIKSGFTAVTGTTLAILQWIAVIVLVTSPLWLPGLAVWWLLRKKLRKQKKSAATETGTDDIEG